jgi:hypothetical protein
LWYLLSPKIVSRRGKAVAEISTSKRPSGNL